MGSLGTELEFSVGTLKLGANDLGSKVEFPFPLPSVPHRLTKSMIVLIWSTSHFPSMNQDSLRSPSAKNRAPFQVSIGFMLLLMVVFAIMSAGLFYASQVPVIQEDISVLVQGKSAETTDDVGRTAHKAFIMFTFTSPLLLAAFLSTGMSILRWFERRQ